MSEPVSGILTILQAIASGLIWLWRRLCYLLTVKGPFVSFFGSAVLETSEWRIVLDTYELDRDKLHRWADAAGEPEAADFPFLKQFAGGYSWAFSGARESIVGYCTCRGLTYLTNLIAPLRRAQLHVASDEQVRDYWKGTVIAIGGPAANSRSLKILRLDENKWFSVGKAEDGRHGLFSKTNQAQLIEDERDHRYGLILRLRHPIYPEHRLVVCAGIGEWGTSGACWYLSQHWRDLHRTYRKNDFAVVVSVDPECDESAALVDFQQVLAQQEGSKHTASTSAYIDVTTPPISGQTGSDGTTTETPPKDIGGARQKKNR